MTNRPPVDRTAVRVAEAALAMASVLAIANLPGDDLPAGWLAAFVLPGALLGRFGRWFGHGFVRALAAIALQAGACWLALATIGPLSQPAALACTILPPLGFAAARHQPADRPLALFLGFCVLLVGSILDGMHGPLLLAWAAAATVALRAGERLAVREDHGAPVPGHGPRVPRLRPELALVLGALLATIAVEQVLWWLPSPSRGGAGAGTGRAGGSGDGSRRIGLDDAFDLGADGNGGGALGPADGVVLVRASVPAGHTMPGDLYLRSGHFARAGLGQWQAGTLTPQNVRGDVAVLAEPRPGERVQQLVLERTAAGGDHVFVPPHPLVVTGCRELAIDPAREWVRQRANSGPANYSVTFRRLRPLPADARTGTADAELLELPPGLQRERWNALLTAWQVPAEPMAAMTRIDAELQRHCRYDRREPEGPFDNALENFLFAETDRHGYCMHFASAAAVLLRLRGIPCRVAVGVHGGEAEPARPGTRCYTSEHAHAWVEVPFAGRGFEVFDPTPATERGQRAPAGTLGGSAGPWPLDGLEEGVAATTWSITGPDLGMLIAIGAAGGLVLLLRRPRAASDPTVRLGTEATPVRHARRLLASLLHELAAAGHGRPPGCTLEAYARDLAARSWLAPEIAAAFHAWQQVRFGEQPFDAERERRMQHGIATARTMRARTSGVPA